MDTLTSCWSSRYFWIKADSHFNSAFLYRIMIIIDFSILSSFICHKERSINKSLSGPVYLQEKKIIKEKEVTYKITCLTLIISELPYPVCSCKKSKQYSFCFLINAPFFMTIFVCCLSSHIFLGQESWPGDAVIAVTSINLGSKKEHTRSRSKEIWTHLRRQCPAVIWALVSWGLYPA